MSQTGRLAETAPAAQAGARNRRDGPLLDLDRYVPAFITFIANKLSNSATVFYQKRFRRQRHGMADHVAAGDRARHSRLAHLPRHRLRQGAGQPDAGGAGEARPGRDPQRDRDDGRTHAISLTAKGRATHDKVIVAALERERRLLSCLKKDEREVLIDLLRRLHGNLGAVTGQSSSLTTR